MGSTVGVPSVICCAEKDLTLVAVATDVVDSGFLANGKKPNI
jgi:hypothetical protein